MTVGLWITRAVAGAVVGMFVFAVLLNLPLDGWITLSAGSLLMSSVLATVQVLADTAHYRAWRSRVSDQSQRPTSYLVAQTLLGFPIVCAASFLSFASAFALFVAP